MATTEPRHIAPDLEHLDAEGVIAWLAERFGDRLAIACSFQKEASVIADMATRLAPGARIFTLDTGVLFAETHETWARFEHHFGIEIPAYRGITLEQQAADHGDALWARDPDLCCSLRKADPLADALDGMEAWASGVRRDQASTRRGKPKLEWDAKHGLWKAHPLADWSERDVWRYIAERELPYHPLHDRGYGSIGCTHCTAPGENRDGRWAGSAKIECGINAG